MQDVRLSNSQMRDEEVGSVPYLPAYVKIEDISFVALLKLVAGFVLLPMLGFLLLMMGLAAIGMTF